MTDVLAGVLARVAPRLDYEVWAEPLDDAFAKFGVVTRREQAAFLGQALVEAGADFSGIVEDLNYSSAARLVEIFPSHFVSVEAAVGYVGNPEAVANLVYAGIEGNGDVASGDGWRYRGRGLIQVTFADSYKLLAAATGVALADLPAWCETPAGAAMSGVWFFVANGCRLLADCWEISAITRKVTGAGMGFAAERLSYSNRILSGLAAPAV